MGAFCLFGGALFLALSFSTYDPFPELLGRDRPTNLGGPIGEFFARILVEDFGAGAYALCFALVFFGYAVQARRPLPEPVLKVLGIALTLLTFGTLCQSLLPERMFPGGAVPLGGVVGDLVSLRLRTFLGTGWTVAAMLVGTLAGVLLVTDSLVPNLIRRGAWKGPRWNPLRPEPRSRPRRPVDALIEDEEKDEEVEFSPVIPARQGAKGSSAKARSAPVQAEEEEDEEFEDDPDALLDEDLDEDASEEEDDEDEEDEYEEEDEEEFAEDEEEGEEEEEVEPEEVNSQAEISSSSSLRTAPRIREAATPVVADGIEVIRLTPDPSLQGKEMYPLPPLSLLAEPTYLAQRESDAAVQAKAAALEEALSDFGVSAQVVEIERGPVITRFDLSLARGTKISKVTGLADDIALRLGVTRVRVAPVKGKSALGVEIPNKNRENVFLRELAVAIDLRKKKIAIPLFLGKDASGHPLVEDMASTPHLLIAGRTGAGKSVFVNNLVLSILLTRYPEEVRLIMIDPKKVELEVYQDIPHLLTKVESNPKRATKILEWAVNQMEERYELLAATGVRHLVTYNKLSAKARREKLLKVYPEEDLDKLPDHLPYIVIIVDELADLMMVAGKEVEQAIARLAQKARAVGIHVVLATQRPSTDVITGLIKSNLPARIAFQTRTGIDSRTILDRYGAEKLLDKGDMLYLSSTSDDPKRVQGPFVSDEEVESVVDYLRQHAAPLYTHHVEQVSSQPVNGEFPGDRDELFDQAVEVVMTTGQASASFLQRRMQVGYARASRLIDLMAEAGLVSEHRGSKAREILLSAENWEELRSQRAQSSAG